MRPETAICVQRVRCDRLSSSYSWTKFGREAEYVVALYLKSIGWDVTLSKGSRGPADITAAIGDVHKWFIQVKSSSGIPRLKGYEVKRLVDLASGRGGVPVVSTLQPFGAGGGFSIGNYSILFYELTGWQQLDPSDYGGCSALRYKARSRAPDT